MGVPQTSHTGPAGSPGAGCAGGAPGAAGTAGTGGVADDGAGAGLGADDAAGGCGVAPLPLVPSGLRSTSDRSLMARSSVGPVRVGAPTV